MRLDALCFDLDDTLLDNSGHPDVLRRTCEELVASESRLDLGKLLAANTALWPAYFAEVEEDWVLGKLDTASVSLEAWRRTLHACDCDDGNLVATVRDTHRRLLGESYCLFADVIECFECLPPNLPVVLITNGASDLQREKIRLLELEGRFKLIVVSGEQGKAKPDPAVFTAVLDALNLQSPKHVWHIGDSLTRDVGGAKAAGLTAVWLNREGASRGFEDPEPDHEISSLADLPNLLRLK